MPKFTWDLDPAIFHLGSFYELRYYSLIFVAVFLGGYQFLRWQIERGGGEEQDASDFFVYGVLAVLIGARLGHVVFYDYQKALEDPLWVLKIWTGGLSSHGAVAGLVVAMWLYTRRKGVTFLEGADRFSFSAALGACLVRIGNFFNSEIVGRPTDQTWGVRFPRYDHLVDAPYRHPSQVYEAVLGLVVLLTLYLVDRWAGREKRPRGLLISTFFVVYFGGRMGIEFFKERQVEALEHVGGPTMGQMLSAPLVLLGIVGVILALRKRVPAGWAHDEVDEPPAEPTAQGAAPAPHALAHDADVDAEFTLSAEERKALVREQARKEDEKNED